ncbi:MAG: hypothetical protein A2010_02655 [Nitrospirae bacterium GWD2_57_9]|nr:MAG: hypothetical protein A2010_02655 [Nitrospirae bacterium GWD2_57_9]
MSTCKECSGEVSQGEIFCRQCGAGTASTPDSAAGTAPAADSNEEELALFVGKNSDKYLHKFRSFNRNGADSFALTWHWPAFLVGFWWLLYRKLYLWAVLDLVLGFIPYLGIIMMFVFGLTGNYLYYSHARKKLQEINAAPGSDTIRTASIARAGGVNNVAVVLAPILVIFIAGILAAIAIPQFSSYRLKAWNMKAKQEIQDACTRGATLFNSRPEKMEVNPDDLLYAGLVRSPEVEMMLLDGRRESFSISAKHIKGRTTYYTDPACALREERQAPDQ